MTQTIKQLIDNCEFKLRKMESDVERDKDNDEPCFPMLITYLDRDSCSMHERLLRKMVRLWPSFEQELKFVELSGSAPDIRCREMLSEGESENEYTLNDGRMDDIISDLTSTDASFKEFNTLALYFLLDTTMFTGPNDLTEKLKIIRELETRLHDDSRSKIDMLFIFLNENGEKQSVSREIRKYLSQLDSTDDLPSIYLLSNRRSDGRSTKDWRICADIATSIIAASNNTDWQVTTEFFRKGIFTVSYTHEEKPIRKISQFIVEEILDELSDRMPKNKTIQLDDSEIRSRLGVTKEGTMGILDDYVSDRFFKYLPDEDQLQYFPLREPLNGPLQLNRYNERDFDKLTMGAWRCYLSGIIKDAEQRLEANTNVRQVWLEQFSKLLHKEFSSQEMIYLADHIEEVKKDIGSAMSPSEDISPTQYAKAFLRYLVASNQDVIGLFVKEIRKQGESADKFREDWKQLLRSRGSLQRIDAGNNFSSFYSQLLRVFFDVKGNDLAEEFGAIKNIDDLCEFISNVVDKMMRTDRLRDVFCASFEEELSLRLSRAEADEYIKRMLSVDNIPMYLLHNADMGQPIQTVVFTSCDEGRKQQRTDQAGEKSFFMWLKSDADLPKFTKYYDTGSAESVEVLYVFKVSKNNLVMGDVC